MAKYIRMRPSVQMSKRERTIEERRPAAAALELGRALVERRVAGGARVDSLFVEAVVLA